MSGGDKVSELRSEYRDRERGRHRQPVSPRDDHPVSAVVPFWRRFVAGALVCACLAGGLAILDDHAPIAALLFAIGGLSGADCVWWGILSERTRPW